MLTIGQLAKKYKLSRSTLIYYDKIGILVPSGRTESNYRLYSDRDLEKMDRIMLFRSAGLPLDHIPSLLAKQGDDLNSSLERRLQGINNEIQALRGQQKVILKILKTESSIRGSRVLTKELWISILKASGFDETGMKNWHIEFERTSPEAHQDFLESLGIDNTEIASIQAWSRSD